MVVHCGARFCLENSLHARSSLFLYISLIGLMLAHTFLFIQISLICRWTICFSVCIGLYIGLYAYIFHNNFLCGEQYYYFDSFMSLYGCGCAALYMYLLQPWLTAPRFLGLCFLIVTVNLACSMCADTVRCKNMKKTSALQ